MARLNAWLTPDVGTGETVSRCLTFPRSLMPHVVGALSALTEVWRWEAYGDMSPADAAHLATIMLDEFESECGDSLLFDIRVSPEDDCLVQKTLDGETWVDAFRLDTDCSLNRIIRNPSDGSYGFEIEDVGFWRFPDGPPGVNAVNPPVPAPTHATAPDPLCAAASNAAMVYVELYKRVAAELLDQVAGEFELAANLGTAISGFLMIIGAAATQPYVAIASIVGLIGVRQQFLDNPLDSDDLERMTCILYDHAVQDAQGSVTFDYDGVFGDVDLPDPKQTLMRLLLGMLGGDALNAAGAVDLVASPDCSACGPVPSEFVWDGAYGTDVVVYYDAVNDWHYVEGVTEFYGGSSNNNLIRDIKLSSDECFTLSAIETLQGTMTAVGHRLVPCSGSVTYPSLQGLLNVSLRAFGLRFNWVEPVRFRFRVAQ